MCIRDSATIGERILAERAWALRDEGLSAADIAYCLNQEKKDIRLVASLDTLEYLRRGGRISGAAALVGGMLSIKPVVGVVDGDVVVLGLSLIHIYPTPSIIRIRINAQGLSHHETRRSCDSSSAACEAACADPNGRPLFSS